MTFLSETPIGLAWIKRFPGNDRETAAALIDEVLLVSRDDLANGLRELLDKLTRQSALAKQKIALYAERPIKKVFGTVPAFFPNSRHGRATGTGVPPVVADRRDQEVGSEGVIAQFITDHCRRNPATAINHPGPTKMRSDKVRKIVILTDFIGSGDRIIRMLESFRYVATLRSWHSYGLIRFVIIAYSGTSEGMARIRLHKWRPDVRIVAVARLSATRLRAHSARRSKRSARPFRQSTLNRSDMTIMAH